MRKKNIIFVGSIIVLSFLFLPCILWATPSGLNNIPTADVVAEKTLVWQVFSEIGESNKPDYFIGFKYGPIKNLEIGLDGRIFPESALEENAAFQVKYRAELNDDFSLALGVSNVGDRAKTGWENPYLVVTYNLGFFRVHAGGSLQRDNEGVFGGFDKTIQLLGKDFTLRTDIIQTNDAHDITSSVGFIYDLGRNFLWESWVSFPTQSGKENIVTIKLNYVISF